MVVRDLVLTKWTVRPYGMFAFTGARIAAAKSFRRSAIGTVNLRALRITGTKEGVHRPAEGAMSEPNLLDERMESRKETDSIHTEVRFECQ